MFKYEITCHGMCEFFTVSLVGTDRVIWEIETTYQTDPMIFGIDAFADHLQATLNPEN